MRRRHVPSEFQSSVLIVLNCRVVEWIVYVCADMKNDVVLWHQLFSILFSIFVFGALLNALTSAGLKLFWSPDRLIRFIIAHYCNCKSLFYRNIVVPNNIELSILPYAIWKATTTLKTNVKFKFTPFCHGCELAGVAKFASARCPGHPRGQRCQSH